MLHFFLLSLLETKRLVLCEMPYFANNMIIKLIQASVFLMLRITCSASDTQLARAKAQQRNRSKSHPAHCSVNYPKASSTHRAHLLQNRHIPTQSSLFRLDLFYLFIFFNQFMSIAWTLNTLAMTSVLQCFISIEH